MTLCTIFSHLTLSETYQNLTDSSGHVEGPVGAFDCIKFGQRGGKLEVKRQNMATAIYVKIRNLGLLDSLHNFQPLNFIRNLPKHHRLFRTCVRRIVAFDSIKFGQTCGILQDGHQSYCNIFKHKLQQICLAF